jgi:hypothetical protein
VFFRSSSTALKQSVPRTSPFGGCALSTLDLNLATSLFVVSPAVGEVGGLALPLLAAAAEWALVALVILVAGPRLARGPRAEALPKAYVITPLFTRVRRKRILGSSF